jgi:perosamine synthetase
MRFKSIGRARFSHSLRDDINALLGAIFTTVNQKHVVEFEKNFAGYVGRKNCISFSLARTAFYFTLRSLDAKKGQKILMPPITIKALLDVVLDAQLVPIFADIDVNTGCFDIEKLKSVVEIEKPNYCLLTYLFGIAPDVTEISQILDSNDVITIEDFSQGLNLGRKNSLWSGRVGSVSIYSSSNIKTLDSYGGGFAVTDDPIIASRLYSFQNELHYPKKSSVIKKIFASFAKNLLSSPFVFNIFTFPLIRTFSLLKLKNFDRFVGNRSKQRIDTLPSNWFYKFSTYQARIANRYLASVKSNEESRKSYAQLVIKAFPELRIVGRSKIEESVFWQLVVVTDKHEDFRDFLRKRRVDTAYSSLVNISSLPAYGINWDTPNASMLYECGVYVPCYAALTKKDRLHVIKALQEYVVNQSRA